MRRVHRQIEEYVNALDVAPEYGPDEKEALARLAWVYQQIGIQYVYLEDPDPAIDYLKQALDLRKADRRTAGSDADGTVHRHCVPAQGGPGTLDAAGAL